MKKLLTFAVIPALAGILFVSVAGCKPKSAEPASAKSLSAEPAVNVQSAEKTSFKEVTSKLDAGGNFYMYLSTEQWLQNLSGKVEKWHEMASSIPDLGDKKQIIDNAFGIGTRLIKDSGLEDISGIGMSSIARAPGFYHNKIIVHHYSGKGNGFMWTMFGKEPHELDTLNLLPSNTVAVAFYDVDAAQIWSIIKAQCEQSGFPEATEFLKAFPDQFEKGAGMKWDDAVGSLGGEFGVVMTLDDSRKISIPVPGQQGLEVPEPGLMIVAKIKNDAIFNRVDALLKEKGLPGLVSVDQNGLRMRTMPVPLPVLTALRPSIAVSSGYLFIASTDALIQEALAVKGGKPGLKSTEEFKKLSADVPLKGNQFCFLSQRFGQTVMKVQGQAMTSNQEMPAQIKEFMQSFMDPTKAGFSFAVGGATDEGWVTIANGNQSSANIMAASAVAVPAMLAAVTLPALAKAKDRAQQIQCMNNLKMIQNAKKQWATEKNKSSTDVPTWDDIKPYLGQDLHCPKGGNYTLGAGDESPKCSIPGHELK